MTPRRPSLWLSGGICRPSLLALALSLVACGGEDAPRPPRISVENPWARAMPAGANTAVYMTLRNEGEEGDSLVGGETSVAGAVEIHESRLEGDVMRMVRVEGVEIPGGGVAALEPGGLHVMLFELERALEAGDTLTLLLRFRASEPRTLLVPVRPPGGP